MYAVLILDIEEPHTGCGDQQVSIEELCFYDDITTEKLKQTVLISYKAVDWKIS